MQPQSFSDRLKELIGDVPANRFAREVDIGESLLRKYLAGATPGLDKVVAIAEAKGVSIDWLARGIGSKDAGADFSMQLPDGRSLAVQAKSAAPEGFALVPRLDIQASAGNGRIAVHEEALEYLAFQADWLRGRGINPVLPGSDGQR